MKTIKPITLGNYIRKKVKPTNDLFDPLVTVLQDSKNTWIFLKEYEGLLSKTPSLEDIYPEDGLDGKSLLVDKDSEIGFLYNSQKGRPKSLSESITELYLTIDISILENSAATELATIKNVVGLSRFYTGGISAESSLDKDIERINSNLSQIAADVFNKDLSIGDPIDTGIFNYNNDGLQSQQKTIIDKIAEINTALADLTLWVF